MMALSELLVELIDPEGDDVVDEEEEYKRCSDFRHTKSCLAFSKNHLRGLLSEIMSSWAWPRLSRYILDGGVDIADGMTRYASAAVDDTFQNRHVVRRGLLM